MKGLRTVFVTVGVAISATPVAAGTVTYEFIKANALPDAPAVAYLEFSAPASSTQAWSTANSADVLSFEVASRFFAPVGPYTPTITSEVSSRTGATLNSGTVTGTNSLMTVTATFSSTPFPSTLVATPRFGSAGERTSLYGAWVVFSSSVPEPSSVILGMTAALAGLGLWSGCRLRREKVVRNRRSAGCDRHGQR